MGQWQGVGYHMSAHCTHTWEYRLHRPGHQWHHARSGWPWQPARSVGGVGCKSGTGTSSHCHSQGCCITQTWKLYRIGLPRLGLALALHIHHHNTTNSHPLPTIPSWAAVGTRERLGNHTTTRPWVVCVGGGVGCHCCPLSGLAHNLGKMCGGGQSTRYNGEGHATPTPPVGIVAPIQRLGAGWEGCMSGKVIGQVGTWGCGGVW